MKKFNLLGNLKSKVYKIIKQNLRKRSSFWQFCLDCPLPFNDAKFYKFFWECVERKIMVWRLNKLWFSRIGRLKKLFLKISQGGARGAGKKLSKILSTIISMTVASFNDFEMPQNTKSSDKFRTIFVSAVVCQTFQPPYWHINFMNFLLI